MWPKNFLGTSLSHPYFPPRFRRETISIIFIIFSGFMGIVFCKNSFIGELF